MKLRGLLGVVGFLSVWVRSLHAQLVITAKEVGGDVVFSSPGGVLDTTGLAFAGQGAPASGVNPRTGYLFLGPPGAPLTDAYSGVTPIMFGPGTFFPYTPTSSGSGLRWGLSFDYLYVPVGFSPGDSLPASTSVFASATFLSLGVNPSPASYVWSWAGGGPTRSITLQVIPEPLSGTAVVLAVGALGFVTWNRRRTPLK